MSGIETHLTPEQERLLEAMLAAGVPECLARRAAILLRYNQGENTAQIAQEIGLSRGRVRFWRRQYVLRGLDIFPSGLETATQTSSLSASDFPPALELPGSSPESEEAGQPSIALDPEFLNFLASAPASPGVEPDDTLAEAGRKVFRYQFAEVLRHEEGTRLGSDIEELHDMRVATRRLRAAFEVFVGAFKPRALKMHLKGLRLTGRTLGRVRDLDVFMDKARRYLQSLPEDQRQGLDPLIAAWGQDREDGRAHMVAYFESPEYGEFKRKFSRFVCRPGAGALPVPASPPTPHRVREIAPILIYSRLAAVRAFDTILENASVEQLHALRIEFKKLRYTLEFFREVLGEEAKPVINEIKGLQDHLGDLNDAQVATLLLSEFLEHWDTDQAMLHLNDRLSPEPIVAYLGYQHAERHRLMVTFHPAWEHFNRPELRRMLANAVSFL
jgi:CHAD domain-containing protein